jgi:hypothetical protein
MGFNVLLGNHAALDVVDELVALARLVGRDAQLAVPVVAGASRLPYVLALPFRVFANGLQINHRGLTNVELDFVFMQDAVADYLQMQIIHPAENGLPVDRFCLDSDGRIFLNENAQRPLKLLAVTTDPRTDSHRYYGPVVGLRFAHGAPLLVTGVV